MSVYTYYLLGVERSLRQEGRRNKDQLNLIDNKDGGMPRTARPCATVGLYCPRSAVGEKVGNSSVDTNSDGVLGVSFLRQVAGNFILFWGK